MIGGKSVGKLSTKTGEPPGYSKRKVKTPKSFSTGKT